MKIYLYLSSIALALLTVVMTTSVSAKGPELKTEEQKFAYIIGLDIGKRLSQQFKQQGLNVDMQVVTAGITDGSEGKEPRLSKEQMDEVVEAVGKKMQEKQKAQMEAHEAEMKKVNDKNEKDGKAFLEANAKKEGVKTTKSGLQYKVISAGKGPKPKATDTVTVTYRGTFIDGTEFDSSEKHGGPSTFALNAVIPGWTEAMQLMPEGSKWQIYIPADLAYGPGGQGPVPPGATLIFDVELIKASAGSGD